MTFDMHSPRFWNKPDTSWKIPSKDICAQVYLSTGKLFLEVNLKSPQISAHKDNGFLAAVFVCVTKNAQTNCQCVSSQFITSKAQETDSCGNTDAISPAALAGIKSPAYQQHYRDTSEIKSRYFSPAMPQLSPALGGTWLQMTGA